MSLGSGHFWFAIQVRSRFEAVASGLLAQKGYQVLLPTHVDRRQWNDRTKDVPKPLFPGYLFCHFDPAVRLPILTTPHVQSIVGSGRTPAAIADHEIETIGEIMRSGQRAQPCDYLSEGQRVRISFGPLQGLEGILISVKNRMRLVLSITLLRRSIAVEVDRAAVSPLPSEARRRQDLVIPAEAVVGM